MRKSKFKLRPSAYILVEVSLISSEREPGEGELVHRQIGKAKVYVSDTGVYTYGAVSCGLQSAVCTALDSLISELDEEDLP
jgi:hypothetical protein